MSTERTPLFRIELSTGTLQVLTPAGLCFATLTVADQLAVVQMVLQCHNLPPEQRTPGRCVDVVLRTAPPLTLHRGDGE